MLPGTTVARNRTASCALKVNHSCGGQLVRRSVLDEVHLGSSSYIANPEVSENVSWNGSDWMRFVGACEGEVGHFLYDYPKSRWRLLNSLCKREIRTRLIRLY